MSERPFIIKVEVDIDTTRRYERRRQYAAFGYTDSSGGTRYRLMGGFLSEGEAWYAVSENLMHELYDISPHEMKVARTVAHYAGKAPDLSKALLPE
jgi:hypothetical protein